MSATLEYEAGVTAPSRAAARTGQVISALVALFLLFDAVIKLVPPEEVVKMSAAMGFSRAKLAGIGVALLVSTLLYAFPRTAVLGAILLTGYLGGAIEVHVHQGGPAFSVVFASALGVLVWLGIYLREPRLREIVFWR